MGSLYPSWEAFRLDKSVLTTDVHPNRHKDIKNIPEIHSNNIFISILLFLKFAVPEFDN